MPQAKTEPLLSARAPGKKTPTAWVDDWLSMSVWINNIARHSINLVLHFENKIELGIRKLSKWKRREGASNCRRPDHKVLLGWKNGTIVT